MKVVKTLVAVAVVAMVTGSAAFAAPKGMVKIAPLTTVEKNVEMETICGKIKQNKDGWSIKVKDGREYELVIDEKSGIDAMYITTRKNKLLIISGFADNENKVFTVERIGGASSESAEK